MNLYVGNVDFKATEEQLSELFSEFGEVSSARIVSDKYSGRSKGFAFIEMPNDEEAREAIESLNGHEFGSRQISVSEARPKSENPGSNRGGARGGFRNRKTSGRY